jgi:hypothetical protein
VNLPILIMASIISRRNDSSYPNTYINLTSKYSLASELSREQKEQSSPQVTSSGDARVQDLQGPWSLDRTSSYLRLLERTKSRILNWGSSWLELPLKIFVVRHPFM